MIPGRLDTGGSGRVTPLPPLWGCLGSKCFRMLGSGTAMFRNYVLLKDLVPSISFCWGYGARRALNAKGAKEKRKGSQSNAVCLNCNELARVTTPALFLLLSMVYGVWGVDKI